MLKKNIEYVDYDGNERQEDFFFNLTKAEVVFMELEMPGGMQKYLKKITDEQDNVKIVEMFKRFIGMSYGIKSDDGKRFIKSQAHTAAFEQTEAYSNLIVEMIQDAAFAATFINGVIPSADPDKPSSPPTL